MHNDPHPEKRHLKGQEESWRGQHACEQWLHVEVCRGPETSVDTVVPPVVICTHSSPSGNSLGLFGPPSTTIRSHGKKNGLRFQQGNRWVSAALQSCFGNVQDNLCFETRLPWLSPVPVQDGAPTITIRNRCFCHMIYFNSRPREATKKKKSLRNWSGDDKPPN